MALWPQNFAIPEVALRYWLGEEQTQPELIQLLHQAIEKVGIDVLQARLRAVSELIFKYYDIQLPCLYIGATNDRIVGREVIGRFRLSIPLLTEYWLEGPHTILQHLPEESTSIIRKFVESL